MLATKGNDLASRKGKDADIEKWEAELRASLASKKTAKLTSATKSLSKQEHGLVAAQLRTESETRKRVDELYVKAKRGLTLLQSIVNARVDELGAYFSELVNLLLAGAVKQGAKLLGEDAFDAYLVSLLPSS